jgi:hypothetical protein
MYTCTLRLTYWICVVVLRRTINSLLRLKLDTNPSQFQPPLIFSIHFPHSHLKVIPCPIYQALWFKHFHSKLLFQSSPSILKRNALDFSIKTAGDIYIYIYIYICVCVCVCVCMCVNKKSIAFSFKPQKCKFFFTYGRIDRENVENSYFSTKLRR